MKELTYCSFAEPGRCLGVIILEGSLNPIDASKTAHQLKINPGGELLAIPMLEDDVPQDVFEAMVNNINRLISGDEARILFDAMSIREYKNSLN